MGPAMRFLVFILLTTAALVSADGGVPDAGTRAKRARPDAGVKLDVQAADPALGGPPPGCPPGCYSSCGSGVAREPGPPTERERRCAGCRNICMDTGKWPPGVMKTR